MTELFPLTGTATSVTVVLLAATALLGTVAVWPWAARPGPPAVAARVGLLAGTNVAVLLAVAVAMNSQFLFFSNWADVAGVFGQGSAAKVTTAGAPMSRTAAAPLAPSADTRRLPPLPPGSGPDGRVVRVTVTGARSGLTGTLLLRLPAGYNSSSVRYPVLMTFSGHPGGLGQWLGPMRLPQALDGRVAAGRIRDPIVVAPTVEFPAGTDTECVDGGPGRDVETWISRDVPDWIHSHLRVVDDRRAWATLGLSSGGWCAAMTTMLHPDRFSAALVFGGYFRPMFSGPSPLPATGPRVSRYDLVRMARHRPPGVAIWLQTSRTDRTSYPTSAPFLAATMSPLAVTAVVLANSGHRMSVFRPRLPAALDWLGRSVAGFAPDRPTPQVTPRAGQSPPAAIAP